MVKTLINEFKNNKLLLAFTLIIVAVAYYFYQKEQIFAPLPKLPSSDLAFHASHVNLLQTDKSGQILAKINADKMIYYQDQHLTQLEKLTLIWYKNGIQTANFTANQGVISLIPSTSSIKKNNQNETSLQHESKIVQSIQKINQPIYHLELSQHVVASYQSDQLGQLSFFTENLTSEPQQGTLVIPHSFTLMNGTQKITASTLTANTQTGDYKMANVKATLQPSR